MRPLPGRLLVKPVETAETLHGGKIILPDSVREGWVIGQCEVVAVGPPPVCQDEDCARVHLDGCHPLSPALKPGAWILAKPRKFVETPEGWMLHQDDVVGIFVTALSSQILT